ncbi:hypothetical protein KP509_19G073700 [Ceratopteris richardii]|uniref:Stress-response A/B barrel domain-containing protein n=1 Tax=Ceratopteris richardii TaxID=49495 RepID=A0A8T2SNJ3_CERRI|nr:hypothetical protein KP509_19G073700 [Ceratopteris richardii]KAH7352988.1 hypothetical protein KP509_19G073700 [Ceratopteris richardii]
MDACPKSPRIPKEIECAEDPCHKKCDDKPKPCIDSCKLRECITDSSAVEHVVLLNMPFLQGDQEAKILHCIYDLQFNFCSVEALVVGRVLNKVENVTHALLIRFSTVETLAGFSKSEALSKIMCLMSPYIHGAIVVDYVSATGHLDTSCKEPTCLTITLMRRRKGVSPGEMDCALHSLKTLADGFCFVEDFTFGSNLFISGDKYFTNGFAGFTKSLCDLDKLLEDVQYSKLLCSVLPLSCSTVTVNVLAFKPIKACL